MVSIRLYHERVVLLSQESERACHERLFDRDQTRYDWQHYVPLIERKPGALRNGAPFADLPAPLQHLRVTEAHVADAGRYDRLRNAEVDHG